MESSRQREEGRRRRAGRNRSFPSLPKPAEAALKIILSRKGFDSKNGGVASPILDGRRLFSLPIPCDRDETTFEDVKSDDIDVGDLVEDLTFNRNLGTPRVKRNHKCHLDPDLRKGALPRESGWLPAFGQRGNAQSHLRNKRVA